MPAQTATRRTMAALESWRVNVCPANGRNYAEWFQTEPEAQRFADECVGNMDLENTNVFPTGMRASVTIWHETGVTYY